MKCKLSVSNSSDTAAPEVHRFEQDVIRIGRGGQNDLTLDDPTRVVSTEHAEIRMTGTGWSVEDLNSKNFTYVNSERLVGGQSRTLQPGDVVEIGPYELTFELEGTRPAPAAGDGERTVFAASFVNPFEEDVQQVVEAVRRMRRAYEQEAPRRRNDALREAFEEAFGGLPESHELDTLVAQVLSGGDATEPTEGRQATQAGGTSPERAARSEPARPQPQAQPEPAREPSPQPSRVPSTDHAPASRIDLLIDTLLKSVARIAEIPWQFRHEFIGQTIMQSDESAFIYGGDPDEMRGHLLNPTISNEVASHRLELLADALEDLVVHQVAMLDGYKAAAQAGMERLLDDIDPETLKTELEEESALYRYIPVLASARAADEVAERCKEIRSEDWSVTERRTFRPAFIKAYLARMTSAK